MNLYGLSNILTGVTSLALAIFVYIKGRKQQAAKMWSGLAASAAVYGFGAYMVSIAKDAREAFFWWQISYIGITLIPLFFVCFVYEFLGIRRPVFITLISLIALLFLGINFFFKALFIHECTLFFADIKWARPIYFVYPPGPLLKFFIIFVFFGWAAYGNLELALNYKKTSALKRAQLKYFLFAAILGFLGGGASFLPCFGIGFYPIFNFTVPLYFFMMSYAILRYRLMDISVAITRTGIFVVVYTLLLGMPVALAARLQGWLNALFGANWWLVPSGSMAVLGTVGPFVYIYLQRKAENRLLREQRSYHEILRQAGAEMTRIRNLQTLLNLIVQIVAENVRISHSAIYLYDEDTRQFSLRAQYYIRKDPQQRGQPVLIDPESSIISWLKNHKEPLIYEEIKQKAEGEGDFVFKELKKEMQALRVAVIAPSFLEGKLANLLILGDKSSARMYSSEDIGIFAILANQIAVAIENASLYENMEGQVRQRTQELVEVQKQLIHAEKLATVGTLAGGVAHEINNPLTAILTNVQMMLASDDIDSKLDRESLELIEEATNRCREIVKKLMTYARKPLETARVSKISLLDVLKNVTSFIGYQLEQENIRLAVDAKKDAYWVMGSPNELEQVITNLILNAKDAIRHAKKGGVVDIAFLETGGWVRIDIKDEGAGIPEDVASKIFDPFFTTKDVGKGVGLGLSICQAIVEKHNGSITFKSEPGNGSVFTIKLPRA